MENKQEYSTQAIVATVLNLFAYIISPILFIWAVNTLFDTGIALTFKTWLAGLILVMLLRFHFKSNNASYYDEYDDYEDEYDEDEDEEFDDLMDKDDYKRSAKIIAYKKHKDKRNEAQSDNSGK